MKNLNKTLEATNTTYNELVDIANDIVERCTKSVDPIIDSLKKNIETLTNDDLRNYMLELSIRAWSFSEIKEKAELKSEISKILKQEAYAIEFNKAEGTVAVKENTANLNISNEILCQCVNNLVADILKTKLDEIHRIVNAIQSVMVSRMSEAKLSNLTSAQEDIG